MASGASKAATAAAEPPPDPPGMRSRSHGLRVGPYAECSVEDPIANSSMLVLPRIGRPAVLSRATTVASYGGTPPPRVRDPHGGGSPPVGRTPLTPDRTPPPRGAGAPAGRAP